MLLQIDSLKTKIVELEKQCGGGDTRLHQGDLQSSHKISPLFFVYMSEFWCVKYTGTKEDLTTIQEQHIDEKLPSGQDDAPMNYTPYIKYTKLQFKVKKRDFWILYCAISLFLFA